MEGQGCLRALPHEQERGQPQEGQLGSELSGEPWLLIGFLVFLRRYQPQWEEQHFIGQTQQGLNLPALGSGWPPSGVRNKLLPMIMLLPGQGFHPLLDAPGMVAGTGKNWPQAWLNFSWALVL